MILRDKHLLNICFRGAITKRSDNFQSDHLPVICPYAWVANPNECKYALINLADLAKCLRILLRSRLRYDFHAFGHHERREILEVCQKLPRGQLYTFDILRVAKGRQFHR
jgi:hypothetical protein